MTEPFRKGWAIVPILENPDPLNELVRNNVPVLAFTTEAERDEAAQRLAEYVDWRHDRDAALQTAQTQTREARKHKQARRETANQMKRLRTRLAEAERLLGECCDGMDETERRWDGLTRSAMAARSEARRFLQGESKDGE